MYFGYQIMYIKKKVFKIRKILNVILIELLCESKLPILSKHRNIILIIDLSLLFITGVTFGTSEQLTEQLHVQNTQVRLFKNEDIYLPCIRTFLNISYRSHFV